MPALPSFMSYRPQLKDKVKSSFAIARKRLEGGPSTSSITPPAPSSLEVLDIGSDGGKDSLDFHDAGSPTTYPDLRAPSPRLQLELNLRSEEEQLSDWFATSFPRPQPSPNPRSHLPSKSIDASVYSQEDELENEILRGEDVFEERIEMMASGDVIANLQAMNASSFGRLRPESVRLKIPADDDHIQNRSRPISPLSTPLSSAVSGTTLARQLIGNGYSLSYDRRMSSKRSFRGLSRADSMTLPSQEYDDHFEVAPDAPPIPSNAGALYVAPKETRGEGSNSNARANKLRRRSSTGSIPLSEFDSASLPASPLPPRPNSACVSPTEAQQAAYPFSPLRRSPSPDPNAGSNPPFTPRKHVPPAIDVSPAAPPPVTSPEGVATSPESVLDYYSTESADSIPPIQRGFRPVFTPITEESMSQLSPPAPFAKDNRRDSQRHQPLGARSPASPRIRSMAPPQRSASDSSAIISFVPAALQPGRPPSHAFTASSVSIESTLSKANSSQLSIDTSDEPLLPPPPLSQVFNRQRSGSLPSPIKVIRDEDLSTYNITVPGQGANATPVSTGSFDRQEFPETATAPWSAAFSPAPPPSEPLPEVPMTAMFPANTAQPNAAQQILLSRAATTARARHSRQVSLGNLSTYRAQQPPSALIPGQRIDEAPELVEPPQTPREGEGSTPVPPRKPVPKRSLPPSPNISPQALRVPPAQPDPVIVPPEDTASPLTPSTTQVARSPSSAASVRSTDSASTAGSSQQSARPSLKSLPPIPTTPQTPIASTVSSPPVQMARGPRPRIPQPLTLPEPTVQDVVAEGSWPRPETSTRPEAHEHHQLQPYIPSGSEPSSAQQVASPPIPLQSSRSRKSTNTIDELLRASTALGSPPPYYTVIDQNAHPPPLPPPQFRPPPVAATSSHPLPPTTPGPPPSTQSITFNNPFSSAPRESTSRARLPRPAGPMGPRGPSMQGGVSGGLSAPGVRDRSASNASLVNNPSVPTALVSPQRSLRRAPTAEQPPIPPTSPKFQPPAIKHRGYTMEAAKWTFSSSQLQGIVSKAIKDSAQTSSIRLLKLESLENEIPEELHRLEMHRTDVKSKYKALTRRRATLFESLTFHLTSSNDGDSTFALRVAEELSSVALSLDQLAEELHSTDYQLAQLNTLVQVHSKSALSMALRKLNASFLKQMADNDALQERVIALEAERDEAWKHAEEIANEYDHLHFQPQLDSPASASNRSSKVSAKRKSSIRVSKAGLRIQSRRHSARSSVASSAYGAGGLPSASSSRSPFRLEKPPPMPPIPKRRPANIITDYRSPVRDSSTPLSMDRTPDTDTRALDKAEEELYSMLGLSVPDSSTLKRPRSMVGHLPSAGLSPPPISAGIPIHTLHRRPSLPGAAAMVEAQNAMTADRNAVVFTFEMLQDQDIEDGPLSSSAPYTRHFKAASPF